MVTGPKDLPPRNREETLQEVRRMMDLHDSWGSDAFDRNDQKTWQYHAGASNAYSYMISLLKYLHEGP